MMNKDPQLTAKVIAACLPLETLEESALGLTKGLKVMAEFDCHDKCAFNKPDCAPGRGGYHGCGSRRILFYVRVDGIGGVGFDFHAPIYLTETLARAGASSYHPVRDWWPMGSVDIHMVEVEEPTYMTKVTSGCIVAGTTDGCYCDGTSLQADKGVQILLEGGTAGIWSWLAEGWLPDVISQASSGKELDAANNQALGSG